jgi:DNA-binding MarR family transcriptional regulator
MVPDNVSMEEAIRRISKANPDMFRGTPKSGVGASFTRGLKSLTGDVRTLYEMGRYGANEAGKRSLERQRALDEEYAPSTDIHRLGEAFDTGIGSGLSELGRQSVGAIAENLPLMGTMALTGGAGGAALRGAQMAGRGLGALAGAYAPRLASNVTAQAATQEAEGKPIDIDVGRAAGTAAVQAPLDVAAQILPLGGRAVTSMFGPEVAKLLRMGQNTAADEIAKNYLRAAMRGVKVNLMEQVPIQVAQAALQRAQTGKSLTDDDAAAEYGQAMYTAALMSPMGVIGGMSDRAEAIRKRNEIKSMGPPKPKDYDFMGPPKPDDYNFMGPPKPPEFVGPQMPHRDYDLNDQAEWERIHGKGFMGPLKPRGMRPQTPDVMYGTAQGDVFTSPESSSDYAGRKAAEDQQAQAASQMGPPKPPAPPEFVGPPKPRPSQKTPTLRPDVMYGTPEGDISQTPLSPEDLAAFRNTMEMASPPKPPEFVGPPKPRPSQKTETVRPDVMYGTPEGEVSQTQLSDQDLAGYKRNMETVGPPKPPESPGPEQPPVYLRAIQAVRESGSATVKTIRDATGVETHVAVMLLDKMEREGLVTKPDSANRRRLTTKLTSAPEAKAAEAKTPKAPKPASDFVQRKIAERAAAKPTEVPPNAPTEGKPTGEVDQTAVGEGAGVPVQERAAAPSGIEATQPTGVGSAEPNATESAGGEGKSTLTLTPRIKKVYSYTPTGEQVVHTGEDQAAIELEDKMRRERNRDAAIKKAEKEATQRAKDARRQILEEDPSVNVLRNARDVLLNNKKEGSEDGMSGTHQNDSALYVKVKKAFELLPDRISELDPELYQELVNAHHDVTKAYEDRYITKTADKAGEKIREEGRQERDKLLGEIEENSRTNPDGLSGDKSEDRILLNRLRKALANMNYGATEAQIEENIPHVLTRAKLEAAFRKRYPPSKVEKAAPKNAAEEAAAEVEKRKAELKKNANESEEDREAVGKLGSSSVEAAEAAIKKSGLGGLLKSGKLTIVDNVDELPPRADGKPHDPNKRGAVFGRGKDAKAFIVAGNVGEEHIMGVLLHEVGAHIGLEDMLPPHEYQKILADFEAQLNKKSPAFMQAWERAQSKIPEGTPNRAERIKSEALAYLVEHTKAPALVQRILMAVRKFANQWLGTNFKLNEHDLREMAMAAARGLAKEGEGEHGLGELGTEAKGSLLDDSKYFYHAVRNDSDIADIVKNGLRKGTNVSGTRGQAFSGEGGTVLVFERAGSSLSKKGYQSDELVGEGNPKPIAILKDTAPYEHAKTKEEEYADLGDKYSELEKRRNAILNKLGLSETDVDKLVYSREVKGRRGFVEKWGDLGGQLSDVRGEINSLFGKLDRIESRKNEGRVSSNDVLSQYDKHGLPVHKLNVEYGDNEEFNLSVEKRFTPPKDVRYSEADAEELHDVGKPLDDYTEPTTGLFNRIKAALSEVPGVVRDMAHGFSSLDHLAQLYGDKVPAFKALDRLMGRRGAERNMRQEAIKDTMLKWWADVKGISSDVMNEFHDIAIRSSLYQVELEDGMASGKDVDTSSPLYAQYRAITARYPQLAEIYRGMREYYDNQSKEFEQYCLSMVSPDAAQKMKAKFASSRIGVYMPFFRRGDYWVTYTDRDGNRVSQAYETKMDQERALRKAKLVSSDAEAYRRLRDLRNNTGVPAGLMGEVLEAMARQGVSEETLDNVYETFLNYMPNAATMQRYRSRENRHGMIRDTLQTFANLAPAMARNLTNLKYAQQVEDEVNNMRKQVELHKSDDNITSAARNVEAQVAFMRKPTFNKLVNTLGYGSYMWYLAGNASSAFVNFTHMPMVVYPLLGGEYGFDKTSAAMTAAMGKFSVKGKIPAEYEDLFKAANEAGVMGRHIGTELSQFRNTSLENYNNTFAKVNRGLNFMFESADRLNRESTLIAAYELAGGRDNHEEASRKAMDMVTRAYGTNLAESGPRYMQNGFARVALTFKRFAMNRFFIMGRLFNEAFRDENAQTRAIARKQLLGLYGTAFLFSGVAGMPLVGAGEMLASQLFSTKDETYDAEEELKNAIGLMAYKGPLGYLTNLEISSRTGWGDMLWKEDPKREAEIGPMLYTMEHMMGPAYSAMVQAGRAMQLFAQGEYEKGFEAMTPSGMRNALKAYRYATEGVVNKNGAKVVDNVNAWNVMMQGLGFAPLDVTEARAGASLMTAEAKKIMQRKSMLMDQMYGAQVLGNDDMREEVQKEIDAFNEANPEVAIMPKNIMQSYMNRQKKAEDAVDGVTLPPKLKDRLVEKFHRGG